jgi:hypothetical protein
LVKQFLSLSALGDTQCLNQQHHLARRESMPHVAVEHRILVMGLQRSQVMGHRRPQDSLSHPG